MTPWIEYQCFHGLGHGLMIATGLDLAISLEVCSRLDRRWDRDACRGGVFMENISTSYGVRSLWLRDEDPLYPCNWVGLEAKRRCYQLVTSRILPTVGDDWEPHCRDLRGGRKRVRAHVLPVVREGCVEP